MTVRALRKSLVNEFEGPYFSTVPPVPDIMANGSDGLVNILQGDLLEVTISLDPGSYDGTPADWWVSAESPIGMYWYTPVQDGLDPTCLYVLMEALF